VRSFSPRAEIPTRVTRALVEQQCVPGGRTRDPSLAYWPCVGLDFRPAPAVQQHLIVLAHTLLWAYHGLGMIGGDASDISRILGPRLRSGIPLLSELQELVQTREYEEMAKFSDAFLGAHRSALRRYGIRWGSDPLHGWSRRWEYLFVAQAIESWANARSDDAGSGVTFFPYYLCQRIPPANVVCCDSDPVCGRAFADITKRIDASEVSFVNSVLQNVPLESDSLDVVYCISVLEHTDNYSEILREFVRVLRQGGLLLLTFDLSLDEKSSMRLKDACGLLELVKKEFTLDSDWDPVKELDKIHRTEEILTTDHIRRTDPDLLPWKYPLLKAIYDLVRGRGWTGGFHSLTCYCLEASPGK